MPKKRIGENRKIPVMAQFEEKEIIFLDRKIDPRDPEKKSRSAILRLLVHRAMLHPKLLDTSWDGA